MIIYTILSLKTPQNSKRAPDSNEHLHCFAVIYNDVYNKKLQTQQNFRQLKHYPPPTA